MMDPVKVWSSDDAPSASHCHSVWHCFLKHFVYSIRCFFFKKSSDFMTDGKKNYQKTGVCAFLNFKFTADSREGNNSGFHPSMRVFYFKP